MIHGLVISVAVELRVKGKICVVSFVILVAFDVRQDDVAR
jgi:hypothetical protein